MIGAVYERIEQATPPGTRHAPGPVGLSPSRLTNSQMASLIAARRPVFVPGAGNQAVQRLCCPSCADDRDEPAGGDEPAGPAESGAGLGWVQRDENTHEPHMLEGTSCTPYDSDFKAQAARLRMYAQLLPAVLAATGSTTNVAIWSMYLGGGGERMFSDTANPGDALVESVKHDEGQVDGAVQAVLRSVEPQLPALATQFLAGTDSADVDVASIVPASLLQPRLAWVIAANPAANVIGEVGSSDVYGPDYRIITGTITLTKQHRPDDRLTVDIRASTNLTIRVADTCDFCPGNIGPIWEQNFTIPLSRLEASHVAGDVHIIVDVHDRGSSTALVNVRDPDVSG